MSARTSLAWAFSGQITNVLIQFGGSLVIARLLSPYELGVYAISMAAIGIAQIFATFGISTYLVREVELSPATIGAAFTVNTLLALGLSAVLVGLSFATTPLLGEPHAGTVLRLVAIANLFGIAAFLPLAMLQREMRFKQLALVSTANAAVQTSATIGFALAGASYRSPAYAAICAGMVTSVLALALGRRHAHFRLRIAGWWPITVFGLQIMSISGVGMLNGRLSDLLVGRLLGTAALGLYARASSLSNLMWENIYGTATRIAFAQLSQAYRSGGDWKRTYLRGFAMISGVMWPVQLGLATLARPAIHLLYGERWLPAALPLSALMVAQCVGVAFGMNWELFVLRGETGRQGRYEVARLLLGLPIFAVGCLFGIAAAGGAKIADALIGVALYYPHVRRLARLDARDMPHVYAISGAVAICAVIPALLLMTLYRWSAAVPLPLVFASVGLGAVFWLGAIVLVGHPLRDELAVLYRHQLASWLTRRRAAPRGPAS